MKYKEFENTINTLEKIDIKLYNKLIAKYGKEKINKYFDKYIEKNKKNFKNIKKIAFFFNIKDEDENKTETEYEKTICNNLLLIYYKEVSKIKLLTKEEEILYSKKIQKLLQEKEELNINNNTLNNELLQLGFEINKTSTNISERKKQREQLKNIDPNNTTLLKKLDIQIDYLTYRNKFIEANLKLVVKIAKSYINTRVSILDLIEEGNLGLIKAINYYNGEYGFRFATYATWWIKQSIKRGLQNQISVVRIPVHAQEINNKIKELEDAYYLQTSKQLPESILIEKLKDEKRNKIKSNEEIDKKVNFEIKTNKITNQFIKISSLDESIKPKENNKTETEGNIYYNKIPDTTINIAEELENTDDVKRYLSTLNNKEKIIICARFGLKFNEFITFEDFCKELKLNNIETISKLYNTQKIYTLNELGLMFNVTSERIRLIEKRILEKLNKISIIERVIKRKIGI